jgi:peptidoglycan/LPS O-acetylase OafA/YrhL
MNSKEVKTIESLDFLRFIGFLSVFTYHFWLAYGHNVKLLGVGYGGLGVAAFTFTSGAGLYVAAKRRGGVSPEYFKGRFFRLLVPFWCAYLVGLTLYWLRDPNITSLSTVANTSSPLGIVFKVLLEIFGQGGYSKVMLQEQTFYLVGEWYIGMIIILTILFPLIYKLIDRWMIQTISIVLLLFIMQFITVPLITTDISTSRYEMNIPTQLLYFVFGMCFAKNYGLIKEKIGSFTVRNFAKQIAMLIPMALLYKVASFLPDSIYFVPYLEKLIRMLLTAFACMLVVYIFSNVYVHFFKKVPRFVKSFNALSYEAFLIHHILISFVVSVYYIPGHNTPIKVLFALMLSSVLTAFFAVVIKGFHLRLTVLIKKISFMRD